MERPVIKDRLVLAYVEYLEAKISAFEADTTIAKSYHAKKHFIEENNRTIQAYNFNTSTLNDKDDKTHDRVTKYMGEVVSHCKDLQELEKMVNPEVLDAAAPSKAGKFEEARSKAGV
jgi:hypothetical protein